MRLKSNLRGVIAVLFAGLLAGCGHKDGNSAPPPVVSVAEAPKVMDEAFNGAAPDVKEEVAAVAAAAKQDEGTAVTSLVDLMHRGDLTPEQRMAAGRCLPAFLDAARRAAANGDPKAADALQAYNVSK